MGYWGMSEHESQAVEGYEPEQDSAAAAPGSETPAEAAAVGPEGGLPDDGGSPEVDEDAEHAKFLETYQPVITRLPQALADERAEQTAAEESAREAEAQAQRERDEVEQRKVALQQEREAQEAEYRAEHFPGT